MPRFESPLRPTQEHAASTTQSKERLQQKKLELLKREQMTAEQERLLQKDLAVSTLPEGRRSEQLIASSEENCTRAESLLSEHPNNPSKRTIDQLKNLQSELSLIQQQAADLDITPETVAVVKRNAKVLKALEAAVGPARPQVIETSSTKEVLANMARQLEKKSRTHNNPFTS